MINQWLVEKIRNASENRILIVDDPHKIITNHDPLFKRDIETHNFIAIFASTNLVFRELLFHARRDDKEKIILIDQTPSRRKDKIASITRAPPLFYPDLLDGSSEDNYIKGDIQQFLIEKTEDKGWPKKANFPPYARIIKDNIEHIVRAHRELRKVDKVRFSDEDFIKIIAFSALEMPTTSFSKLNPTEYDITISNASSPFFLVFCQAYDDNWEAFIDGKERISDKYHFVGDGFLNVWYIDRTGSFTVTLEFSSQRLFDFGLRISIATLATLMILVIIPENNLRNLVKELKKHTQRVITQVTQ